MSRVKKNVDSPGEEIMTHICQEYQNSNLYINYIFFILLTMILNDANISKSTILKKHQASLKYLEASWENTQ